MKIHYVIPLLLITMNGACTRYIQRPPEQVDPKKYAAADPRLVEAMDQCQWALYNAYSDVKKAQRYSDWMTFAGGTVASAGAATTTGITAVSKSEDKGAKTSAVIAGIVGAVGGIIALASKLTDGPERSTTDFVNASKHWTAGITVADQVDVRNLRPGDANYKYAMDEFRACRSSPGSAVSPLPAGTQPSPSPHDAGEPRELAPPPRAN